MWATNDLSDYSANAILRDGTPVRIRAIRPGDKQRLALHFEGLSNDSRYHRFFGVKNRLTSNELRYFTEPDFIGAMAALCGQQGLEADAGGMWKRLLGASLALRWEHHREVV